LTYESAVCTVLLYYDNVKSLLFMYNYPYCAIFPGVKGS